MAKPNQPRVFRITALIPLPEDELERAEKVAKLRPAIDALKSAVTEAGGDTDTDTITVRGKRNSAPIEQQGEGGEHG